MVTKYEFKGYSGFIGLLGPTRMNYPFNQVILEEVKKILA
jgi:transcriptional regulator of heat shock response